MSFDAVGVESKRVRDSPLRAKARASRTTIIVARWLTGWLSYMAARVGHRPEDRPLHLLDDLPGLHVHGQVPFKHRNFLQSADALVDHVHAAELPEIGSRDLLVENMGDLLVDLVTIRGVDLREGLVEEFAQLAVVVAAGVELLRLAQVVDR